MVERQLLWYMNSSPDSETHIYRFLMINSPRELKAIVQALHEQIAQTGHVIEDKVIAEDLIKGSGGLHYSLREIETDISNLDFSQVYQGKVRHDRRLQPRRTSQGWNNLISKASKGNI